MVANTLFLRVKREIYYQVGWAYHPLHGQQPVLVHHSPIKELHQCYTRSLAWPSHEQHYLLHDSMLELCRWRTKCVICTFRSSNSTTCIKKSIAGFKAKARSWEFVSILIAPNSTARANALFYRQRKNFISLCPTANRLLQAPEQ